jgi:hypothetical protein
MHHINPFNSIKMKPELDEMKVLVKLNLFLLHGI